MLRERAARSTALGLKWNLEGCDNNRGPMKEYNCSERGLEDGSTSLNPKFGMIIPFPLSVVRIYGFVSWRPRVITNCDEPSLPSHFLSSIGKDLAGALCQAW